MRWAREHQDLLAVSLIVLAALLPRAALMFRLPVFYVVGSRPYYATALQLAAGLDVTALSLRHTPGYPIFLTGVIGLFGLEPEAIAAVICYYAGKLAVGRLVGLGAGLLAGLNTTLVVYEQHILTEPLFSFLLLLSMLLLVAAARGRAGWLFLGAGAVAGLAALTRPIGQTIVLAGLPALWLCFGRWCPTLRACLLLVAGFGLAAGPWIGRNALTQSEASVRHPGSTLLGHVRQEREYTKGYFTLDGSTDPDPLRQEARRIIERMAPSDPDPLEMWTELQQRLGVSPAQANRLMGEIAVDTILRHPWHYAQAFSGASLSLFAGPKDERLEDFLPRTRNQWPGRFLAGPIREGSVPDLNPSGPRAAQKWEAANAAAVADFFRPDQAAPLLAALFPNTR